MTTWRKCMFFPRCAVWISQCPNWVWCPREIHPFGTEWHAISDGILTEIVEIEIFEGKNRHVKLKSQMVKRYRVTVDSHLCLTKVLYNTGKVIIFDSSVCVVQGLIKLRKVGIFVIAIIKKEKILTKTWSWKSNWYTHEK